MRSTRNSLTLVIAGAAAALACDGTDVAGPPATADTRLQIVSGHQQEDTVFAGPADSLRVRLTTPDGRGVPGVPVIFRAPGDAFEPRMHLIRDGREFQALEDTTDASGHAAVQVAFAGPRAGYAWVRVEVPLAGLADSAFYHVLPGVPVQPAHTIFPPAPTVMVRDVTTIYAVRRDAHGNHVLVTPTACASASPSVDVEPGCRVWGLAFGNAAVRVEHDGFARTITVGVLPIGTIAGPTHQELLVARLDGTVLHRLPRLTQVDWAPSGDRLVGVLPESFGGPGHLHLVDIAGATRELIPEFAGSLGEEAPQYSSDGQWIYFSAWATQDRAEVWRIPAAGGAPERLVASAAAGERHRFPSPSPDGRSIAFATEREGAAGEIRVLGLETGAVRGLGIAGAFPRWSPDGEWIAFASPTGATFPAHRIALVRPDGSGLRLLEHGDRMDWSPDGRYLSAAGGIMSVETGELVRFGTFPATGISHGGTGFAGLPAWRP